MRENVNVRQSRERREPNRGTTIIGEDKKGRTGCAENPVVAHAVHDRTHAVLPDSEMNVAAFRLVTRKIASVLDVVQSRAVEIGAAADQKWHRRGQRLQNIAAGFARRNLRVARKFRDRCQETDRNLFLDCVVE